MIRLWLVLVSVAALAGCFPYVKSPAEYIGAKLDIQTTYDYFELHATDGVRTSRRLPTSVNCHDVPGDDLAFVLKGTRHFTFNTWSDQLLLSIHLNPGDQFSMVSNQTGVGGDYPSKKYSAPFMETFEPGKESYSLPREFLGTLIYQAQIRFLVLVDRQRASSFMPVPLHPFESYTVQLPDAILNGERIAFAPVTLKHKQVSYRRCEVRG